MASDNLKDLFISSIESIDLKLLRMVIVIKTYLGNSNYYLTRD